MSSIHAAALTDVGRVRTNNEDTFGIDSEHGLYVVCDGMGGAASGEIASHLACTTVLSTFSKDLAQPDTEERLELAIRAANAAVRHAGLQTDHRGMGTTLVAAAVVGSQLLVANVGDSRAYLLQQEGWLQLTTDHSYINELIRTGSIHASDASAPELQRFASTITRAIGAADEVQPEFFSANLREGDTVLLCSDGLTRYLDSPEFNTLIDPEDLEASCQRLIDSARHQGGIDNITCMLLRYTPGKSASRRKLN